MTMLRRLPRLAALALAGMLLSGCGAASATDSDPHGWWRLAAGPTGAQPADADGAVYLRLVGGRLESLTPCGVYSALFKGTPGGEREVASPTGDPIACEPADMGFDARYLVTLQDTTSARLDGGELVLAGGQGELRYRPLVAESALDGEPATRTWRLQAFSFGGQLRAAVAEPAATLTWREPGRASGSSGCHDFSLTYSLRVIPVADESAELGEGTSAIAFADEIPRDPMCEDSLQRRQDNWLRAVLREDAVVLTDGELLSVTNGGSAALYRVIP